MLSQVGRPGRRPLRGHRRTWVLGGGGARGAAQVGVILALLEHGVEPPARLVGVSVGALNAGVLAAYPSIAGARMLREIWLSPQARDVFRAHPLSVILSRLRGGRVAALPATNVTRVIDRSVQLMGIDTFEGLRVPLQVVATDLNDGRPRVLDSGPLRPALQASTAIPGVFPIVEIDGHAHLDGGIVDNMPISVAIEDGAKEVLGVALMAGGELDHGPANWGELIARTLQLSLHHRMLADYERLHRRARLIVLCPVLPPNAGIDMKHEHVEATMEGARAATARLLEKLGRHLLGRSGMHYLVSPGNPEGTSPGNPAAMSPGNPAGSPRSPG